MPSHPAIPPLIAPYIALRPFSLTLLSSTLGSTTNWLVLRLIHAFLNQDDSEDVKSHVAAHSGETRVVLVSWIRATNFWKEGGRKLGINPHKVYFVNFLAEGLSPRPDALKEVEEMVLRAIEGAKEDVEGNGRVLLVLDGLDFFVAATGCPVLSIIDMIGDLRERCDSTVITSCADHALMQSPTTPLKTSHAAFVMNMAHQAILIMSVKGLQTGFARDVSGVLRISKGARVDLGDEETGEKECLYFVEGDGGVKVFERGAWE